MAEIIKFSLKHDPKPGNKELKRHILYLLEELHTQKYPYDGDDVDRAILFYFNLPLETMKESLGKDKVDELSSIYTELVGKVYDVLMQFTDASPSCGYDCNLLQQTRRGTYTFRIPGDNQKVAFWFYDVPTFKNKLIPEYLEKFFDKINLQSIKKYFEKKRKEGIKSCLKSLYYFVCKHTL
ncbi:MAG: hypothetical protein GXN99_02235 [Candidatus Nanohaloarchaeota archaeon]|nr:hypothetical protein [Candidatus Nanohaloarchaeota archaeon]